MIRDMETGIWGQVLKEERSLIVNDPGSHPGRVSIPEGHPAVTWAFRFATEETIGMVSLANKESGYDMPIKRPSRLSVGFVEAHASGRQ